MKQRREIGTWVEVEILDKVAGEHEFEKLKKAQLMWGDVFQEKVMQGQKLQGVKYAQPVAATTRSQRSWSERMRDRANASPRGRGKGGVEVGSDANL